MDEISKIVVDEFQKKSEDTWVSLTTSDLITKKGAVIRIPPGMVFRKGSRLLGIDLAQLLDDISRNRTN